jgi:hypothetical protein
MAITTMNDRPIVTILGAGASKRCGYPLARDLFPAISAFGSSLDKNCAYLKIAINHVIEKAEEFECATPDDLAFQMHQQLAGEVADLRQALRTILYSRIVTDAYFLFLERGVTNTQLQSYKDYWHEALGSDSGTWFEGFPETRHRLMSFNYDRMPELAFRRYFSAVAGDGDLYESLNTGLAPFSKYLIADSQFCFLKFHGSVGIQGIGQNERHNVFGRSTDHYSPVGGNLNEEISDRFYFREMADGEGFPVPARFPLLAFPSDKHRIEAGGKDINIDEYIRVVKPAAEKVFENVEEIRVIGYSFQAPDKEWLLSLIRSAPKDAKLILQNPEALSICRRLRTYDKLDFEALTDNW